MADDVETQIMNAAVTIRGELVVLVPADADTLGAELDEHIARARAVPPAELPPHLDEIIELLSRRGPTRKRLSELYPQIDRDRGAADVWAPDQMLAGTASDDKKLFSFTCKTCQYKNKLPYRP